MAAPSRREALRLGATAVGAALAGCTSNDLVCEDGDPSVGRADQGSCTPTADNIEGPFYRGDAPERSQLNTQDRGGTLLRIEGRVTGPACGEGLPGATVEVWQANAKGSYDNESEEFEFRATVTCDDAGNYAYETVLPGRYLNGGTYRPRHIHYRVAAEGHATLVTQLYFCGDKKLEGDAWALPELTIVLDEASNGALSGVFDVVLATA